LLFAISRDYEFRSSRASSLPGLEVAEGSTSGVLEVNEDGLSSGIRYASVEFYLEGGVVESPDGVGVSFAVTSGLCVREEVEDAKQRCLEIMRTAELKVDVVQVFLAALLGGVPESPELEVAELTSSVIEAFTSTSFVEVPGSFEVTMTRTFLEIN